MAVNQQADEELEARIYQFAIKHFRTLGKVALIGFIMLFSVGVLTGSFWKAVVISFFCFVLSTFNTWRRYLEPISFLVFCIAVVYWCDEEFVSHIKTALSGMSIRG
jgi:hypothetical protein